MQGVSFCTVRMMSRSSMRAEWGRRVGRNARWDRRLERSQRLEQLAGCVQYILQMDGHNLLPSCPTTFGYVTPNCPSGTEDSTRSVWQIPVAIISTKISPSPGAKTSISSSDQFTVCGSDGARATMACVVAMCLLFSIGRIPGVLGKTFRGGESSICVSRLYLTCL
jgi:hypothetical protein